MLRNLTDCDSSLLRTTLSSFGENPAINIDSSRIHDLDGVSGSITLEGANGPLFMGGNIEELALRVERGDIASVAGHFKFFRRYKSWGSGELEREIQEEKWVVTPQDPNRALAM